MLPVVRKILDHVDPEELLCADPDTPSKSDSLEAVKIRSVFSKLEELFAARIRGLDHEKNELEKRTNDGVLLRVRVRTCDG